MCEEIEHIVDRAVKIREDYFTDLNSAVAGLVAVTKSKLKGRLRGPLTAVNVAGEMKPGSVPPRDSYVTYRGYQMYYSRVKDGHVSTDAPLVLAYSGHKAIYFEPDLMPVCEMVEAYYRMIAGHGKMPDHRINVPCLFIREENL